MYDVIVIILAIMSMILSFVLGVMVSLGDEKILAHKSYIRGYHHGYKAGIRDGAAKTRQDDDGTESEVVSITDTSER